MATQTLSTKHQNHIGRKCTKGYVQFAKHEQSEFSWGKVENLGHVRPIHHIIYLG